jgi:hypothetical protein
MIVPTAISVWTALPFSSADKSILKSTGFVQIGQGILEKAAAADKQGAASNFGANTASRAARRSAASCGPAARRCNG